MYGKIISICFSVSHLRVCLNVLFISLHVSLILHLVTFFLSIACCRFLAEMFCLQLSLNANQAKRIGRREILGNTPSFPN